MTDMPWRHLYSDLELHLMVWRRKASATLPTLAPGWRCKTPPSTAYALRRDRESHVV